MAVFRYPQTVLFRHCDPARIMFFPRMLELVNDAVENFFERELGWPFHDIHPDRAVPTVEISTRFNAPCRLGEQLVLWIEPTAIGRTSLTLKTTGKVDEDPRFETVQTLVCIASDGRPTPWPDTVRARTEKLFGEQG
ncbi:acyl-CoA thioesterase [Primorskyibacter sp. 2E107]|uniref:acyl-CoA thioesterase n=1 Tax=Primorskyibacter sp. 2E107 TaxID=3403458 RepID=UPI003AF6E6E9